MKVRIKQNGNLELTPETELENYALYKWYDGYIIKGKETLSVNLFVEDKGVKGVCMVASSSE